MHKTILGVFSSEEDAQTAIEDLESAGYSAKDISIVMRNKQEARDFADSTGTDVANSAVSGAVTGGVLGGLAGLLIGIGAIVVPGIGALLIGGPIAAALGATGAAATTVSGATTGLLAGGLIGALVGLGVPKEDATVYEERIRNGGILVAVPSQSGREEEVMAILEDNDADQIRAIDSFVADTSDRYEEEPEYAPYTPAYAHIGAKGGKSKSRAKKVSHKKRVTEKR